MADKTYQAYYTKSDPITDYMVSMLNLQPSDTVFEPCGGDGVFVDKNFGFKRQSEDYGL